MTTRYEVLVVDFSYYEGASETPKRRSAGAATTPLSTERCCFVYAWSMHARIITDDELMTLIASVIWTDELLLVLNRRDRETIQSCHAKGSHHHPDDSAAALESTKRKNGLSLHQKSCFLQVSKEKKSRQVATACLVSKKVPPIKCTVESDKSFNMGDYYGHGGNTGRAAAGTAIDADKIFVGGLSWQTTEESLRYHFEQYGPVVSVEVMRDRVTGDPRGFAFVVFKDVETVDLVMNEPRHEINHKVVDVKRAQARGVAPPSIHTSKQDSGGDITGGGSDTSQARGARGSELSPEQLQNKVFVGGIPPNVDRDELKQIFEEFGQVADAIVMMDQQQMRSRGFGFVTFENGSNGAQYAIAAQPLLVHGRRVEVKLATPKGDQKRFPPVGGPSNLGLRAGMGSSSGEFAGLAASYGRSGWKAGYGTKAFGKAGWQVEGWDDGGPAPERSGFSFEMLKQYMKDATNEPPAKRTRRQ